MRSTQDPIRGLQKYIEDWGLATEDELKTIDKDSKAEVEKAVEEAKASPEPDMNDFWTDIYYKGTEPPFMRGREREEVSLPWPRSSESPLTTDSPGSPLLDIISYRFCFLVVRLILRLVEYSHPAELKGLEDTNKVSHDWPTRAEPSEFWSYAGPPGPPSTHLHP